MDEYGNDALLPSYTYDDFLTTTEPYEYLFSIRNTMERQQAMTRMKDYAGSVGVKNFTMLWKAYIESVKERFVDVNATEWDGLPVEGGELECGKYRCTDYGVTYFSNQGFEVAVCPHPIAPIRRYKNLDTGEELLELWYRKGSPHGRQRTETRIVSKEAIVNDVLSLAKYGVAVSPKTAKELSAYLIDMEQMNYDRIEEYESVKRLGWIGSGSTFSPYVEDVFFDGEEEFGGIFRAVAEPAGTFEAWLGIVRKVRAERTPARIYLAASFASVILSPCGLLPFIVHAFGGSEGGKTVALMLAASVWADPELGEYVGTYNGTRYAQETTAGFLNSLPMCIDELQIQTSQGAKDFDDIIYQLCEGVSKKQGTASGGLRRQQKWRCAILSNGEHTIIKPQSGGGARNRVIELEAPVKMYSDLVGLCEVIKKNYGHAGRAFVEWLTVPENMDRVRRRQKEYYRALQAMDVTDKQAGSASAILTADEIATEIIFRDGNALTAEEMKSLLLPRYELDVNRQALEWLREYVEVNSMHFYVVSDDGEQRNEPDFSRTELWGEIDEEDGTVYIIRSVFNRVMRDNGHDARTFLVWAKRVGLLLAEDGRNDKVRRMHVTRRPVRCVCLRSEDARREFSDTSELPF